MKNRGAVVLSFAVCLIYLVVNWRFDRPDYIDEMGYLAKAAAIAGYVIDFPSPWYSGYPLILAPLFRIFSDPYLVWRGILVMQAVMWGLSFLLLFHLLRNLFPEKKPNHLLVITAISAFYPAWITMSGYAFATTAFVFVYMIALYALSRNLLSGPSAGCSFLSSLAVGYLVWIHPMGLGVLVAYLLILVLGRGRFVYSFVIQMIVVCGMALAYRFVFTPWVNSITMLGEYRGGVDYGRLETILSNVFNVRHIVERFTYIFAPYIYFVIASLGVVNFFFIHFLSRAKVFFLTRGEKDRSDYLIAFIGLSFLGCMAMTILHHFHYFWTPTIDLTRFYHGRYPEMAFLPVLAVGLACNSFSRYRWLTPLMLGVSGFLYWMPTFTIIPLGEGINIQAFWPSLLPYPGYFTSVYAWAAIGVLVCTAVAVIGKYFGKVTVFVAIALYVLCVVNSYEVRRVLQKDSGTKPSAMVQFIRDNFPPGSKIYFDKESILGGKKHYHHLLYYLFNYEVKPRDVKKGDVIGDGLLLTSHPEKLDREHHYVVAMDGAYHLFLMANRNVPFDTLKFEPASQKRFRNVYFATSPDDPLFHDIERHALLQPVAATLLTQVGKVEGSSLVTVGVPGYFCFGPYSTLEPGRYRVQLLGTISGGESATVRVKAIAPKAGAIVLATEKLRSLSGIASADGDGQDIIAQADFTVPERVIDLQIVVTVGMNDKIRLDGYVVDKLESEADFP